MLGRTIVIFYVLVKSKSDFEWESTGKFDGGNPLPFLFYRHRRVDGIMYFKSTYFKRVCCDYSSGN